jgi:hypothetical protein
MRWTRLGGRNFAAPRRNTSRIDFPAVSLYSAEQISLSRQSNTTLPSRGSFSRSATCRGGLHSPEAIRATTGGLVLGAFESIRKMNFARVSQITVYLTFEEFRELAPRGCSRSNLRV